MWLKNILLPKNYVHVEHVLSRYVETVQELSVLVNRPGVAGAGLQAEWSLIIKVSHR